MTREPRREERSGPDPRQIAAGFVALATSGLSGCNDNGAVDPPPPPFSCDRVGEGQTLSAIGSLAATTLTVDVADFFGLTQWSMVNVRDLVGVTLVETTIPSSNVVRVTLELTAPDVTMGRFTLEGQLSQDGTSCMVERTFTFQITAGDVQIAVVPDAHLPLAARDSIEIHLVGREGRRVELSASTAYRGASALTWSVSGGAVLWERGDRLGWELPAEPGFYQAELVADFGSDGMAVDTLAFEVA